MAHRKTSKRSKARTMLRLADLEQSKNAVLHSLGAAQKPTSGPRHHLGDSTYGLPVIRELTIRPSWPSAICSRNLAKHTTIILGPEKLGSLLWSLVADPSESVGLLPGFDAAHNF